MSRLQISPEPSYAKDHKRLRKKHIDLDPLKETISLIIENTEEAKETLKQRHNMHKLKGVWAGSNECHICNAGDWLLVWRVEGDTAYLERTGTHDEIFKDTK